MKKRLSWEKEHKNELKRYYEIILDYYKSIPADMIVLTREYTDHLYKKNLFRKHSGAHLHHIIPRACGGTDDPRNLIWLTLKDHCDAHGNLYRCNRKNVSIRTASTMLKYHQNKRNRCLTAPENRKKMGSMENSIALYGENSYQWSSD
jgi:hypothetical protein